MAGQEEDPMFSLFQSLLNPQNASSNPNDPNSPDTQIPAALAALLNGGTLPPNFQAQQQAQATETEAVLESYTLSTSTWRLIHFFSALLLSIFALMSSPARFTGSQTSRGIPNVKGTQLGSQLFMYFAAVEAVLLTSRLFLERGKPLGGIVGTVTNLLPGTLGNGIRVLTRYGTIFSSVVQDALVVVWVVGMVGWWNSLGTT
jgi:GET complex subunit GET2